MFAGKIIHLLSSIYTEFALGVLLALVAIGFHFNGLYGQDAHEYLRMMRELNDIFFHGNKMSHTIFPVMYPLIGFFLYEIIRNDFIAMQLVAILSFLIAFHFLKKLLRLMYAKRKEINIYLILFFALSPDVLRFSLLSMSDMLCMMFLVVAVFQAANFFVRNKSLSAGFSFLFCSCAAATRYASLIIIIPILLFVGWNLVRRRQWRFLFLAVLFAIIPLLPDLLFRNRLLFFQFSHGKFFIDYGVNAYSWSPMNFFRRDFLNADGLQHYNQWNVLYALFNIIHPAFLVAGILFLFFLRKRDFESPLQKLFALIVILYACYLAGLQYQSTRYLLQTFPFIILVFFPAFLRCCEKFFRVRKIGVAAASSIITLQLFLFFYSSKSLYQLNQAEQLIAESLHKYPSQTIYTCSINPALQSYRVPNPIVDLYPEKIDKIQFPALLLFDEKDFSTHFAGLNPMVNYNFIKSNYHIYFLQSFSQEWKLYEIKN